MTSWLSVRFSGPLEQTEPRAGEDGLIARSLEALGLLGTNLVDGLAHVGHDVEAVEHVEGSGRLACDHLQVRLPHVAADEPQLGAALAAKRPEELEQRPGLAVLSHPQQPAHALIDLVDDREELVAPTPQDFIDADRPDPLEIAVLQTPADGHLDRSEHALPRRLERLRYLGPAHPFRPAGEEPGVRGRRLVLAAAPGHRLDYHAARGAVDPAHGVHEKHRDPPQRNELETTRRQRVVPGSRASAS